MGRSSILTCFDGDKRGLKKREHLAPAQKTSQYILIPNLSPTCGVVEGWLVFDCLGQIRSPPVLLVQMLTEQM